MINKIFKLTLSLTFLPVNFFLVFVMVRLIFGMAGQQIDGTFVILTGFPFSVPYELIEFFSLAASVIFCAGVAVAEYYVFKNNDLSANRMLTGLRFGPLVVFTVFTASAVFTNLTLVEYSKMEIRTYVLESPTVAGPHFELHNDWQIRYSEHGGSGKRDNYLTTALENVNHSEPDVRARSILMASKITYIFDQNDNRFGAAVSQACVDESNAVRSTAEKVLSRTASINCEKFLLRLDEAWF